MIADVFTGSILIVSHVINGGVASGISSFEGIAFDLLGLLDTFLHLSVSVFTPKGIFARQYDEGHHACQ